MHKYRILVCLLHIAMSVVVIATSSAIAAETDNKVDFGPYMADLQRQIKRSWFPPKGIGEKRAVVVFKIHADGSISHLRLDDSSGVASVDKSGVDAVLKASPFRPLPIGAPADVDIQFTFDLLPASTTVPILSGSGVANVCSRELYELVSQIDAYIAQIREIRWSKMSKQEQIVQIKEKYSLAQPLLEKILAMDPTESLPLNVKEITLANLGRIAYANKQGSKALSLLNEALRVHQEKGDTETFFFSRSLKEMVVGIYIDRGDYESAEQPFKDDIAIKERAVRTANDPFAGSGKSKERGINELVESLGDLAAFDYQIKSYAQAENYLVKKLAIEEKNFGSLDRRTIETRKHLFIILSNQSKTTEQEELYKKLVAEFRRGKEYESELATSLCYLAWCYCHLNKLAEAQQCLDESLSLRLKVDSSPQILLVNIQNLATVTDGLGELSQAEELYRRLLAVSKTTGRFRRLDELAATQQLACFYWRHGQLSKAEPLIEREKILLAQVPQHSFSEFMVGRKFYPIDLYEHWAWFYYSRKQFEKSRSLFEKIKDHEGLRAVYEALNKKQQIEKLNALTRSTNNFVQLDLATSLVKERKYSEAEKVCIDALSSLKVSLEYSALSCPHRMLTSFPALEPIPQLSGAGNSTIGPSRYEATEISGVNTAGPAVKDPEYVMDYRPPGLCFGHGSISNNEHLDAGPTICNLPPADLWFWTAEIVVTDPQWVMISGSSTLLSNEETQACIQLVLSNIYRKQGKVSQAKSLYDEAFSVINKLDSTKAKLITSYFAGAE